MSERPRINPAEYPYLKTRSATFYLSKDPQVRAQRYEDAIKKVLELCDDVSDNPIDHVPPWEGEDRHARGQRAWTVEGHPTREQHLVARIESLIEKTIAENWVAGW
ncbi:hypothetical protein [Actinopolymorpha sp. B9G3]|uniref:hypothetical protein n=1 Tax=Actinopolymorpha sp. B9G3 TaxID=3158970 RepID=UPI0032D952AC